MKMGQNQMKNNIFGVWAFKKHDETIAEVDVTKTDQPWFIGTLNNTTPQFAFVKELWEKIHIEIDNEDWDTVDILFKNWDESEIIFHHPDGQPVAELLLSFDENNEVYFRYSDEPFDEE